jgi:hypothetical protein
MDEGNQNILDYVLVPANEIPDGKIGFWKKDRAKFDPYRLNTLDDLLGPIWKALIAKMSALPGRVGPTTQIDALQ